jgi:hypothetical protein
VPGISHLWKALVWIKGEFQSHTFHAFPDVDAWTSNFGKETG